MNHTPDFRDLLQVWLDFNGLSDLREVDELGLNNEILDPNLLNQTPPHSPPPPPDNHDDNDDETVKQILLNTSTPSNNAINEILRQIEESDTVNPSQQQQGGGSINVTSSSNEDFNQREIRESVSFSVNEGITDPVEFYLNVMDILNRSAQRGTHLAHVNDRIRFEISTQNASHHINFNYDGKNTMQHLQQLFDKLVQLNKVLSSENDFNFRLQVVNNRSGAGKRKLETILDGELVDKKRIQLMIPTDSKQTLCFAPSIAGLLNQASTNAQLLDVAKNLQNQAGLSDQTLVSFSDVIQFENIVQRKMVTFFRADRVISNFETDYSDHSNPMFLLLLDHHYYSIRNIKGFLDAKYFCPFCFTPYQTMSGHHCAWFCRVCVTPAYANDQKPPSSHALIVTGYAEI
nr:uncharacterized protein LOC129166943 [Nothobranchius furzeri]